jgi:hypothetical protein
MKMMVKIFLLVTCLAMLQVAGYCQKKDSVTAPKDTLAQKKKPVDSLLKKDSAVVKKHDPGKASLYAAIFPGAGQVYNKKYWKVPIVLAAVGIPTYTFFFNKSWYKKTRYALAVFANQSYNLAGPFNNTDSFNRVDPLLQKAFYYSDTKQVNPNAGATLQNDRDYFRKNEDYSILFFLLFYALQIVDATVDAHLKDFNVTNDLSLRVKPDILEGTNNPGLSFVLDIHKPRTKPLFDNR